MRVFLDNNDEFSSYSVPEMEISSRAAKVNKLSTTFCNGEKVLVKENKIVACDIFPKQSFENFVNFIKKLKNNSHDHEKERRSF